MPAWVEYDAEICTDCLVTSANGWDDNQPLPDPVPLGLVPPGTLIGWGEDLEAHFSWLRCDTCGCTLGGDRFDVQISEPAKG